MQECPLAVMAFTISKTIDKTLLRGNATLCKGNKCAWYSENTKCCNIQHLENIAYLLKGE